MNWEQILEESDLKGWSKPELLQYKYSGEHFLKSYLKSEEIIQWIFKHLKRYLKGCLDYVRSFLFPASF